MEENLAESFDGGIGSVVPSLLNDLQPTISQTIGTTPREYLLSLRVEAARRLLVTSDTSLAAIATDCGFTDQSHFTKRFQKVTGMTPHQYRDRFRT